MDSKQQTFADWAMIFGDIAPDELRPLAPGVLAQLAELQHRLSRQIVPYPRPGTIRLVAGVDVSANWHQPSVYAAVVVLQFPDMVVVEEATAFQAAAMPYIPGYLAFRELPVLLAAWRKLKSCPDLVLVDGHGICHPRGLGLASHLGVLLDIPAIGCAKSLLIGEYREPGAEPGARQPLLWQDRPLGAILRTRARSKPLFISIGQHVDLTQAVDLVMGCCRGYRLPEPTRQAHLAANCLRKKM